MIRCNHCLVLRPAKLVHLESTYRAGSSIWPIYCCDSCHMSVCEGCLDGSCGCPPDGHGHYEECVDNGA